jgi:hypothetical protein
MGQESNRFMGSKAKGMNTHELEKHKQVAETSFKESKQSLKIHD